MELMLCVIWAITAPILIWSRWNGPALFFNIILAINTLSGFIFLVKGIRD